MNAGHIDGVCEIEKRCFSKPWSRESVARELENESAFYFVAEENGFAVGYIGTYRAADECYVNNFGVLPEYRGRGIGTALLKAATDGAEKSGMSFISLEVRASNLSAVGIYEKAGFKKVGVRRKFYSEPVEDGLIMTCYFNEPKDV